MKKKRGIKVELSNRWLYTLIIIGILAMICMGVYAIAGVSHNLDELNLPSCSDGQVLGVSESDWACIDMSSGGVDTRCDTSGTCSQVCIGSDCETSWPRGSAIYEIPSICSDYGLLTFSTTCETRSCKFTSFHWYYDCDGGCPPAGSRTCPNTLQGYLVN